MRRDFTIKTASFTGTSDLTIVAPIKKGFVPSLEAVTYKTRVERVLKTLHAGRVNAHEYELARILSDAVERVGRIHSIRIAILEPEDKVMLAVTFDGSWESYIRVIWQKVSRSLDLIFCNTEGYVIGWERSFEQWCAWLKSAQAETSFLYSPPGLSYQDTQYLRSYERRLRREGDAGAAGVATTRIRIATAEEISDQVCKNATDPTNLGLSKPVDPVPTGRAAFRQGMRSLAGLYRLADLHLPGTDDGRVLHRAALELLREFVPMLNNPSKYQQAIERAEKRFEDAMDWLRDTEASGRPVPKLPDQQLSGGELDEVQGGIVQSYPDTSHGCLLLLAFDSHEALASFLSDVIPTKALDSIGADHVAVNIAMTLEGLRLAGLTDDDIAALPEEFVQGMERRAGMLGDVHVNHPRRWRRPALNWGQGAAASDVAQEDAGPRVDLSAVHLALQLRLCRSSLGPRAARELVFNKAQALLQGQPGARPLSLQWMHRLVKSGHAQEHFGFLDSESSPTYNEPDAGKKYANRVHLGEVLLGHNNAADTAPIPGSGSPTQELLRDGSFLVIRKLRQDIGALQGALDAAVQKTVPVGADAAEMEQQRHLLLAKMMGRWPAESASPGVALAASFGTKGLKGNDFNFNNDESGSLCPFHAHIRRANPRDTSTPEPPGARPARIVRRGMSYGPLHDPKASGEDPQKSLAQERGLVFMAYNASIGEQFEVVQRWLTGGNSSGSYSGQSDPFIGIAEPGRQRFFRFEHDNQSVNIGLDGSDRMHDEPQPIVRLEWGMYLFTPSLVALKELAARAKKVGKVFAKSWSADKGEKEIARLRHIEETEHAQTAFDAWKAAVEDPAFAADFTAASIWAAIREDHGGVLKTPLGALVASRELVSEVLHDNAGNLTATGYLPRMHRSFGPLYLGMDAGQVNRVYEDESADVNAAIMGLVAAPKDFAAAVAEASRLTKKFIDDLAVQADADAKDDDETRWEVTFEAREIIDEVLAAFCEKWFGLADGPYLKKGSMRWSWKPGDPPLYPGHFMAPSRYTFQPHPGPEVERIGAEHGQALQAALKNYLTDLGSGLTAPVARAVLACPVANTDATYPARTLAGVLMGFLPTTDGNMRRVLNEWLNEGTLWSLRAKHSAAAPGEAAQAELAMQVRQKMISAMQLRAAPELLWRTAVASHTIGATGPHQVAVRAGEIVIASLISATQQCLESNDPSVDYAFGGRRNPLGAAKSHPTHACPGYGPATAVMLGFFQGLVECGQALRAGPGALSFSMEGYVARQAGVASVAHSAHSAHSAQIASHAFSAHSAFAEGQGLGPASFAGPQAISIPLLVIGDSWLTDLGDVLPPSLASRLRRLGYELEANSKSDNFRDVGWRLSQLADSAMLNAIGQYLADVDGTSAAPKSILIGGGGNDLVDPPAKPKLSVLFSLLNANAASAAAAVIEEKVHAFIDVTLFEHYCAILDVVTGATDASIPILIHAYDHPIPDGKKFEGVLGFGKSGPWLKTVFDIKNIALSVSRDVMKILIDRLNKMVFRLEAKYPNRVHHIQLTQELANQGDFAQNYRKYWDNELHASAAGYDVLAKVVQKKLVKLGIK